MDKVSMSCPISFCRYQAKCVIKFLLRQLMTSWIWRFFLDQPLRQWLTGKKWEDENTKIWISWERKELFAWNKNIVQFFKGYHLMKNKNLIKKIADTSFKKRKRSVKTNIHEVTLDEFKHSLHKHCVLPDQKLSRVF